MISCVSAGSRFPVGSSASRMRGLVDQRPGDDHPLLLAAGELEGQALGLVLQAHQLEHPVRALAATRRAGTPSTSRASATLSSTVRCGSSLKSWKTTPMFRRRKGMLHWRMRATFRPPTRICPRVAGSAQKTSLSSVVFPAPEGPVRNTNSPFSTSG